MQRGATNKDSSKMINIWVPEALLPLIQEGVRKEDSDRSKFVRSAVREKLQRLGINTKETAR